MSARPRYVVREARLEDADEMGRVHVRAWLGAYRGGLMPDDYLDSLSATERAAMWRQGLATDPRPRCARLVAVADAGDVIGFAMVGPAGGEEAAVDGELYAINVDPDHWGTGAAPALLEAALDGCAPVALWCITSWRWRPGPRALVVATRPQVSW